MSANSQSPKHPSRQLAAVWFADIVGYSRLMAADEVRALQEVATLQRICRRVLDEEGGGDGVYRLKLSHNLFPLL